MVNVAPHWKHFEHGADIGVHGVGVTKSQAFVQAARALTAVVCDINSVKATSKIDINCAAPDDELLFVDWLNAIIYEMACRKMLFSQFNIALHATELFAQVWGELVNQQKHKPAVEIKGATYTMLRVYQDQNESWHAKTVVDV